MRWINNLKIGTRLISAFILIALMAGVVGVIGITNIKQVNQDYSNLYVNYGVASGDLGHVGMDFHNIRAAIRDVLIKTTNKEREPYITKIKTLDTDMDSYLGKFETSIQTEDVRTAFNTLTASLKDYKTVREQVSSLAQDNKVEAAETLFYGDALQPSIVANENLDKLIKLMEVGGLKKSEEYSADVNSTVNTMFVIVGVTMILAISIGIFVSRIISKPINRLVAVSEQMADGDLNVTIQADTKDEVGILATSFLRMSNNMNEVMQNINSAADQVASGARQMSESSIALSEGATEQASSVEELSASLEEISSQTKLNAQHSNNANQLAEAAQKNAVHGNEQMGSMLRAMEEINDSSINISKIIKVIDEIAFQTNILALNAAVEAARAGQHGKGFAVVAEEVRNLAARSANAAKETTAMIEGSIKKVDIGTKIANNTAVALQNIVNDVAQVAELISNITISSNEQAIGVAQINQGILQVSHVVQTNSATSEESAASSEELTHQALMLQEQVNRFQLKKMDYARENFSEARPSTLQTNESYIRANATNKTKRPTKISLSDNDFGKY
ncbi:methyl-accepting chemotaxis protein [Paenibacillus monticola]|uniref:HAMP domain-containing protein n=1 Tax=Paenibacillus monticola TaxID=2666075 RepID=A0A7X2H5R5_9BACL|nr:methyl-accepting chemotaxis protein [Paenibacillus monticola]MRN54027.1 HAMP domain-containing protein [Paenibacillus monticola]